MKKFIFIISLFSQLIHGQVELLKTGNVYFAKAKYKESIEAYKKVESNNMGGFGLYSNMGRAYAFLGQDALAILYLEKALKFSPNDELIKKDLHVIRMRVPDLVEPQESFVLSKWWNKFAGICTPGTWATISLIVLALIGFLFLSEKAQKGNYTKTIVSKVIIISIFIVTVLSAGYRNQQIYHNTGLIIMSGNIKIKAGPDEQSPDIIESPPGTKVYKKDHIGTWTQVVNEFGDVGWIPTKEARSI